MSDATKFLTCGDDPAEHRKLLFDALLERGHQIASDNVDIQATRIDLAAIVASRRPKMLAGGLDR